MINTNRADAAVVLFLRPANGMYQPPKVIRLKGKSQLEEIEVVKKDMPNFFVEAFTVSGSKVCNEVREVIVPPEKRVLTVKVTPSAAEYKPGAKAKMSVKVTDFTGEPYVGSLVLAMYDKGVEYISGGSNVPEIKEFYWKWHRQHNPSWETSLNKGGYNILKQGEIGMGFLGVFGASVVEDMNGLGTAPGGPMERAKGFGAGRRRRTASPGVPGRGSDGPGRGAHGARGRHGDERRPQSVAADKPGADRELQANEKAEGGGGGRAPGRRWSSRPCEPSSPTRPFGWLSSPPRLTAWASSN